MKRIFTFVVILLMISPFFAQSQNIKPKHQITLAKTSGQAFEEVSFFSLKTQKNQVQIPKEFKNYTILSMNKAAMKSFTSSAPETMSFSLPGKKNSMLLELVKVNIFTDDFSIVEMPSENVIKPKNKVLHYRGIVKNSPNSIAAITIVDQEISGIISLEDEVGNLVLGKLDASRDHILYADKDISHLNNFVCKTNDSYKRALKETNVSKQAPAANATKCPGIFFDIANDIVRDKGGSQGASNYIQSIFNQVAILYNNEDVNIKISGIRTWTSTAPFNNLNNYRSYRNQNGFNGDLGHFVTYNYSGGVAWLNGLCGSYLYGLSGINRSYNNVPRYSWTVNVIAHELGHNFGSNHTHSCAWNGNNTAIDGCYTTEGGCSRPGIPSNGGTIMSYCHLTSTGINLTKGFGPQPGNVIRSTINRANCVDTCDGGGGGDEVSCTGIEEWSDSVNYTAGDKVTYQGKLFERTENNGWNELGTCSQDLCYGVDQWSSNTSYSPGDLVVYQGTLFKRNENNGWDTLGDCGNNSNPCSGIDNWSENVNYSAGDRVVYQGTLFEWNGNEWIEIATCATTQASLPGASSVPKTATVMVYPNPATDYLHITINNLRDNASIVIKNIQGKNVITKLIKEESPNGSIKETLNIQSLHSGVYFIQIITNGSIINKKITIK